MKPTNETHKTNASPPTFSDLLKECERGPFTAHKGQDDDDAHLVDNWGATVAIFIPCGDEDRSAFIHAQACARLLNWAHAGGVKSYLSMDAHLTSSIGESEEAKRLIAALNGMQT